MRGAQGVQEVDHVIGKLGGCMPRLQRRLNDAVKRIARDLKADVVTAFVYDQKTARFHLPAGHGLRDPDTFKDPQLGPRSRRVAGKIARERRPIIAEQVDALSPLDGPFARREEIRSAGGFPLLEQGVTVGVLFVSFRRAHTFEEREKEMICARAARLAEIIVAAAPWEELRQLPEPKWRRDNPALSAIVELACDSLNLSVAIWQLQPDGKTLALVAGTGLTRSYVDQADVLVGDGGWLSGIVEGNGVTVPVSHDLRGDRRFPFEKTAAAGWKVALGFPICSQGRVCGVVEGLSFDPEINPGDQDVLRRLADLAGVIIENAHRDCEARVLDKVLQDLSKAFDFNRAVQVIVDGALKLTGAESGCMYQFDRDNNPSVLYSKPTGVPLPTTCTLPQDILHGDQPGEYEVAKVPSQIEVPIKAKEEWIGTLYVSSRSPRVFTDHDKHLLRTLADQASLIWGPPQSLLLDASTAIEEASTRVVDQQKRFEQILAKVRGPYDFAALQLINPEERVIETVRGIGLAAKWEGLAKHYLEKDPLLRDIQADIALAGLTEPPRAEIIAGYDSRFDKWIYEAFTQGSLVRAFVPMILARDADGKVLEGKDLDDWLQTWGTDEWKVEIQPDGERQVVELKSLGASAKRMKLSWEIIGTVEVGYDDWKVNTIDRQQVVELVKRSAHHAVDCYRTLVEHVFQVVVDHAVRIVGAEYAILHFGQIGTAADSKGISYVYEVFRGQVTKAFLGLHSPQKAELGQQAILEGKTLFVPDPSLGHDDDQLSRTNLELYEAGVRSIAAIPLLVEPKGEDYPESPAAGPTKFRQGVLYVGFNDNSRNGADGVHRFTLEEIGWLRLFVNSAADAIRHATAYTRMRERARLLANLHSVAESLVSNLQPDVPKTAGHTDGTMSAADQKTGAGGLLFHIAGSVLNILGADVVTIYEYLQPMELFLTPPDRAGRLREERKMTTAVGPEDTPLLIIKHCIDKGIKSVYAIDSATHPVINPTDRRRPLEKGESFVKREKIRSSAGILLVAGRKPDEGGEEEKEIVGVMFINYRRTNRFTPDEKRLIETLASAAAVAIKNRRLLEAFIATDRELLTAQTSDEVFAHIVERARVLTGAQVGELFLIDPVTGVLRSRALSPMAESDGPTAELRRTFACQVVSEADATLGQTLGTDGSALGVPLSDGTGAILGVFAVFNSRPNAFHLRNRTLLEALAVPAVLALQNDETRKRLRAAGDFATLGWLSTTVLHDVRGDFGSIRLWAHDLRQKFPCQPAVINPNRADRILRLGKQTSERIRDYAEQVSESVLSVMTWIDDYQRAQSPGDLLGIILAEMHARGWPTSCYVGEPELPHVMGHKDLFRRIFRNFFKNAECAIRDGGTAAVSGKKSQARGKLWIVVTVENTGTSIPKEILERLVLGNPVASTTGGSGLGLKLSRTYVEHLGGHFKIDSSRENGTVVTIMLPAWLPEASRPGGGAG
jgi:GAF domain-containing protein